MALTATATERVREDIIKHLNLRDSALLRCEFQSTEPDLSRVARRSAAYEQMLDFIRGAPSESGIVYCQSRKTAETRSRTS